MTPSPVSAGYWDTTVSRPHRTRAETPAPPPPAGTPSVPTTRQSACAPRRSAPQSPTPSADQDWETVVPAPLHQLFIAVPFTFGDAPFNHARRGSLAGQVANLGDALLRVGLGDRLRLTRCPALGYSPITVVIKSAPSTVANTPRAKVGAVSLIRMTFSSLRCQHAGLCAVGGRKRA